MSKRIDELMYHSGLTAQGCWDEMDEYDKRAIIKFSELIVQECANYIRCNFDGWEAEPLAHSMEVHFGVHGDYA